MKMGAKKKNDWPLNSPVERPPTLMVEAASSTPSSRDPPSPMNTRAGNRLWGRKPTHTPRVMTAHSAPGLSALMTPASASRMA